MSHYICTGGCKGISDKPGACEAADCIKYAQPLQECNCIDGKHGEVPKEDKEVEEDLGDGSENIE